MGGLFPSGIAELAKTAKSAKVLYMENKLWYEQIFVANCSKYVISY